MKKLLLFLSAGIIITHVSAQSRIPSVVFARTNDGAAITSAQGAASGAQVLGPLHKEASPHAGERTTAAGGRWYDFGDDILALSTSVAEVVLYSGFPLWKDTTAVYGYMNATTPTYYINKEGSMGLSFHPWALNTTAPNYYWNDSLTFPHMVKVTATDAYTIDSVMVFGSYYRSSDPTKTSVVDTLRFGLVYGDGTSTSDLRNFRTWGSTTMAAYGVDTVHFLGMMYDSITQRAAGASLVAKDIPLTSADSAANFVRTFAVNYNVPAGNVASLSVSFRSGDASWVAGDTVVYADRTNKYHNFQGKAMSSGNTSTLSFPPYDVNMQANGYWKYDGLAKNGDANGWAGYYLPNWAWTSSTPSPGSASDLQFPYLWFHVTCATCGYTSDNSTLGTGQVKGIISVTAVPNPASNEVAIRFNLAARSNVAISISDVMGRVLSTESVNNIGNGKAVINTADYAPGVYFYTVTANGERATGRILVSH